MAQAHMTPSLGITQPEDVLRVLERAAYIFKEVASPQRMDRDGKLARYEDMLHKARAKVRR